MKAITLVPYTIRIRRLHSREDEELDSFGENADDLFLFLTKSLSALRERDWRDENGKTILSISDVRNEKRTLAGILETGEYGTASKIKDVIEGKIVHRKKRTHADMQPFYFLMSLPYKRTKGVVLLQTTGILGAATVFRDALNESLKGEFADYRIHLRNLASRSVFDKFLSGHLRELRFIRFHLPKGIEDAYAVGHKEIRGRTEYVIKPKGLMGMPFAQKIRDILDGKAVVRDLVELADEHFEANEIKFSMEVDGKRRLLTLKNPDNVQAGYDITKSVIMGDDGHPTFESLDGVARTFLGELELAMYGVSGA